MGKSKNNIQSILENLIKMSPFNYHLSDRKQKKYSSTQNEIAESFKPLLMVIRLLGFCPIRFQSKEGLRAGTSQKQIKYSCKLISLPVLYTGLIQSCYVVISQYVFSQNVVVYFLFCQGSSSTHR